MIASGVLVILIIGIVLIFTLGRNNLKENYNKELIISFQGIDKTDVFSGEVVLKNNSKKEIIYNLELKDIENNYLHPNDLIYTVEGIGKGSRNIGNSILPINDMAILESITLEPGITHTYKINIIYQRSDDSNDTNESSFKGILKLNIIE